ncbi:MAG: hypothetical protein AAF641_05000 [Pseudomonadota bacterium]
MTGDRLPARVRPEGALTDLLQDNPAARLSAALRAKVIPFVQAYPNWDGVVTLGDGAAHHWLHISAGEAISMMGFLTPRLIADLGGAEVPDMDALSDTMSRPERLAAQLLSAQVAKDAAALTGHLIGAELAAAKVYWLGQEVVALGQGPYLEVLKAQGVAVSRF